MEDIAIGLGTFASEQILQVGLTSAQLVAANPNRTFLIISLPISNPIFISTIGPATLLGGLQLGVAGHPLFLDIKTYGNLCQKQWFAIASGGATPVSVWEGEFDPKLVKSFLDKLRAASR